LANAGAESTFVTTLSKKKVATTGAMLEGRIANHDAPCSTAPMLVAAEVVAVPLPSGPRRSGTHARDLEHP